MTAPRRRTDFIGAPTLFNVLSSTASEGSPMVAAVPSTNPHSVSLSSPVLTVCGQTQQALPAVCPGLPFLQMEAIEVAFAHAIRSTATTCGNGN